MLRSKIHVAVWQYRHWLNCVAFILGLILFVNPREAYGGSPAQTFARKWIQSHWLDPASTPPFSFVIAGEASEHFLPKWQRRIELSETLVDKRTYTITYVSPDNSLLVKCRLVEH